jgi:hypothetical protein
MSTLSKLNVGQLVSYKGKETTVTGINITRKGKMYALATGDVVKAQDVTKVKAKVKEGVKPETYPLPTKEQVEANKPKAATGNTEKVKASKSDKKKEDAA